MEVPTLDRRLEVIRNLTSNEIQHLVYSVVPKTLLPTAYLEQLSESDRSTANRAIALAWAVSKGSQVPREMQLKSTLATYNKKDSVVHAGTGTGKTLPIALNILLDDPKYPHVTLTISPLKRLQITQENDFNTLYGIPTVAINEDTPRQSSYWHEHIYDPSTKKLGKARLIITTVEQLFKTPEGHLPRLATLVRNPFFQRFIKRIYIDEAHCIHTDGFPHYGSPAFRPAFARLDELKAILPQSIPWQAMSATLPSHILRTVVAKLMHASYEYIRVSANRPNTTYATHCVVSSLDELRNYECFLTTPFDLSRQPRILIFFDNKNLTRTVARHLESRLPKQYQGAGVVRHYHSGMSDNYLGMAHTTFTTSDGMCKILCATSGESVGVDFPDVKIVCNAGLPSNIVEALQRSGHLGRRYGDTGLFVIFHEPWICRLSLTKDYLYGDQSDPDRPPMALKPTSQRQDRAPLSLVQLIRTQPCIRQTFANYLDDDSTSALEFITRWCCDSPAHKEGPRFSLSDHLPGPLFCEEVSRPAKRAATRNRYRPVAQRADLDVQIISWLHQANNNPLYGSRTMHDILSDKARAMLVQARPPTVDEPQKIVNLLDESEEWGNDWSFSLCQLIKDYDRGISTVSRRKRVCIN